MYLFKVPDNLKIATELNQIMQHQKDSYWVQYSQALSSIYQLSPSNVDDFLRESSSRKFYLMRWQDITNNHREIIDNNYAYMLSENSEQVFLVEPPEAYGSSPVHVDVTNPDAKAYILGIIKEHPSPSREASWEEMETFIDKFCDGDDELPDEYNGSEVVYKHSPDGVFQSAWHAPHGFAYRQNILNSFAKHLTINQKIEGNTTSIGPKRKEAEKLLRTHWIAREKQNFSWLGLLGQTQNPVGVSGEGERINNADLLLRASQYIKEEFSKQSPDYANIKKALDELKENMIGAPKFNSNILFQVLVSFVQIITQLICLCIGIIGMLPSYWFNLPYFGKPQFFLDRVQGVADECIELFRCIVFPLAIIQAYNTSGSMNVLQGPCTRMVETLLERVKSELTKLDVEALLK